LELIRFHLPESYFEFFELYNFHNKKDCLECELNEKASFIPERFVGKNVVMDGFCNPISILGHQCSLTDVNVGI